MAVAKIGLISIDMWGIMWKSAFDSFAMTKGIIDWGRNRRICNENDGIYAELER